MDWSAAKDYEIRKEIMRIIDEENEMISKGEGEWKGCRIVEKVGAVRCLNEILNRIIAEIDRGRQPDRFETGIREFFRMIKEGR